MKQTLTSLLDFFYPPFKKWMPVLTFRYAVCGGGNTLLGLLVYYIGYHYLFVGEVFRWQFFVFKPHMAALFLSGGISFIVGFMLNKYVVFTGSLLKGRVQLFRYFLSFLFNIVLNYFLLKLLVEGMEWYAFTSQLLTTVLIIGVSYLTQRYFSFKVK